MQICATNYDYFRRHISIEFALVFLIQYFGSYILFIIIFFIRIIDKQIYDKQLLHLTELQLRTPNGQDTNSL